MQVPTPCPRCSGRTRAIAYRLLWIDEGRPTPQPSASSPASASRNALSVSEVTKCAISSTSKTSPETWFRITAHCSYCSAVEGRSSLRSMLEPYAGAVTAPVRTDEELDLRIESLAYGGNGVARLNGFVVFVRRGLPGDVVRARVTKVKRNHAEALALEVVEAGAPRVDAPCEHYPACGGCRFQDLAYEAQLGAKAAQVEEALRRIGRVDDPPLEPIVPAEPV